MTSGVKDVTRTNPKNFLLHKGWNGGDGKYLNDGSEKWNNYSMNLTMESDQFGSAASAVSTISGPPSYTWTDKDEMYLQSKLVKKIKGHEFNLAVNLAQGRQTVTMCVSTLRQLGRSLTYLKHGHVANAFRELGVYGAVSPLRGKDISARWLEMQYGWLPLVSDVYEAAKAYEALTQKRKARIVATVKRDRPCNGSASPTIYESMGTTTIIKRIVCELNEQLSASRSLGLLDPLSVVWEVIPYSFVVDWFLPIGTYLENLAVIPFLDGRFLTTQYERTETRYTGLLDKAYAYDFGGAVRRGLRITLTRSPSFGLTTQRPTFQNLGDALSPKRIANAVSLVHQALREISLPKALSILNYNL